MEGLQLISDHLNSLIQHGHWSESLFHDDTGPESCSWTGLAMDHDFWVLVLRHVVFDFVQSWGELVYGHPQEIWENACFFDLWFASHVNEDLFHVLVHFGKSLDSHFREILLPLLHVECVVAEHVLEPSWQKFLSDLFLSRFVSYHNEFLMRLENERKKLGNVSVLWNPIGTFDNPILRHVSGIDDWDPFTDISFKLFNSQWFVHFLLGPLVVICQG